MYDIGFVALLITLSLLMRISRGKHKYEEGKRDFTPENRAITLLLIAVGWTLTFYCYRTGINFFIFR